MSSLMNSVRAEFLEIQLEIPADQKFNSSLPLHPLYSRFRFFEASFFFFYENHRGAFGARIAKKREFIIARDRIRVRARECVRGRERRSLGPELRHRERARAYIPTHARAARTHAGRLCNLRNRRVTRARNAHRWRATHRYAHRTVYVYPRKYSVSKDFVIIFSPTR